MNLFKKYILICIFTIVLPVANAKAEVRVFAQIEKDKDIYVGESFGYHIIIDGDNKAGDVDISPLSRYKPKSAGNRDLSQTSIQIINGKTTRNIKKQFVMSYMLSCNKVGTIELPSVTVTLDGKKYRTNPLSVNILKPGTTELLNLEVTLSQEQCYVGQPIVMDVKFYISADIGEFSFDIPVFSSEDFEIEDPDILKSNAKEYDLGNGIIVKVNQYRTTHKGKESVLLTFSKILIPTKAGEITIPPSSVSADVAVGRKRYGDAFFDGFFGPKEYKRFLVNSKPLQLNVKPLPQQAKPTGFYGLVGDYTILTSATPVDVSVGDPITLTIKIGGGDFLKPIRWPALEKIKEMAENFKIPQEKASPVIENGFKIFTQTIRANNDKVQEIPAIPLSYYDADKGRYETAKSKPIKLNVSPTKILTGADLQGLDFTPVNREVEAIKKGLSANYESLEVLTDQSFSPIAAAVSVPYLFIWSGPLALLIISSIVKFFTHTTDDKILAKRKRTAAGKAINMLKKLDYEPSGRSSDQLAATMRQYLGDRFDKTAGSLTSNDCYEIIIEETNDSETAKKYEKIISDCEKSRYAPSETVHRTSKAVEAVKLIKIIEKKSKK